MKIEQMAPLVSQATKTAKTARPQSESASSSFAKMMEASTSLAELNERHGSPKKSGPLQDSDAETIKEKGFRAYAEELQARKMKELREKILERMGLSEDDLNNMPADQRATVEDIIAREIQRRMQANAELASSETEGLPATTDGAPAIADQTGTGASGTVLLDILDARNEVEDRNELPGKQA